jgi:hypothetical protein
MVMRRRIRSFPISFVAPVMMARLFAASWETIVRRSLLMAQGTCSQAEYRRMVAEKMAAMQMAMGALLRRKGTGNDPRFVGRARTNAKRLRRKV